VTQYDPRQVAGSGVSYAEDHSAVRPPYFVQAACWLVVLVVGIIATAVNPGLAIIFAVGLIGSVVMITLIVKARPVGIRVGGDGIRIGGVRRAAGRAGSALPWADHQRKQVLFAPWESVRRVAVITDKSALRDARSLSRQGVIRLGVLSAPFTRAALLIEVDPDRVVLPEFREPDTDRSFWRPAHMALVEVSPVWYVPTRHPGALRAALAQQAPSFGDRSDSRLPSHLRLLLERGDVSRA
jgi:hypothetical protein